MDKSQQQAESDNTPDSSSDDYERVGVDGARAAVQKHGQAARAPALLHRFRHNASILCLTTSDERIFAGTQAGEILVGRIALA